MAEILDYAERRTREALGELPDGASEATDSLEGVDGPIELRVRATLEGEGLLLDFDGTDAQVEGNLNCPLSVTRSACFFAVRVVCDPDAPPSAGAWRPVTVRAPEGSVLNAQAPAAVAAGNVETSSRVADLVFDALAAFAPVPANGQGTMNNLTLAGGDGASEWTYYETIGGGQGACPDADGPSAVHVAMSNTLNTPVEAFESQYPLRVRELSIRRGSGGDGARRGGEGVAREIEALEPATFTLIAERRAAGPRGREGGGSGSPGRDTLNGEPIPSKHSGRAAPGRPPADRDSRRRGLRAAGRAAARTASVRTVERIELNGAAIAFEREGDPDGPSLALVHGLGGSMSSWSGVRDAAAAAGWDVISLDCRGSGASDKPPGPYSVDAWSDDLIALLDALEIERIALAGHSVGCMVAARAAVALGGRAAALALLGGALEWAPGFDEVLAERAGLAREGRIREVAEAVAAKGLTDHARAERPELVVAFVDSFAANDPDGYAESALAAVGARIAEPASIACPVLAFAGSLDAVTPLSAAEAIALGGARRADGRGRWLRALVQRRGSRGGRRDHARLPRGRGYWLSSQSGFGTNSADFRTLRTGPICL